MALFKQAEPYEPQDVLVIFSEDGTADIAQIDSINDERVYALSPQGNYAVPIEDVKSYTGRKGRVFVYPTTMENITDCKRIAALERSTVLRNITHYEDQSEPYEQRKPIFKFVLIGLGILALIFILKAV